MTSRFRIDRFTVPARHLPDFLAAVAATHARLREEPGLLADRLFQRPLPEGRVEVLTLAEWSPEADVDAIATRIRADQKARGFDTRTQLAAWEVTADLGWFTPVQAGGGVAADRHQPAGGIAASSPDATAQHRSKR